VVAGPPRDTRRPAGARRLRHRPSPCLLQARREARTRLGPLRDVRV